MFYQWSTVKTSYELFDMTQFDFLSIVHSHSEGQMTTTVPWKDLEKTI
jgi:hypothetical protein